jgi:hypothetical protein
LFDGGQSDKKIRRKEDRMGNDRIKGIDGSVLKDKEDEWNIEK